MVLSKTHLLAGFGNSYSRYPSNKSETESAFSHLRHRQREVRRKGPTSSLEHEGPKTPGPKTLRRLAQIREAARKSRLRKI